MIYTIAPTTETLQAISHTVNKSPQIMDDITKLANDISEGNGYRGSCAKDAMVFKSPEDAKKFINATDLKDNSIFTVDAEWEECRDTGYPWRWTNQPALMGEIVNGS